MAHPRNRPVAYFGLPNYAGSFNGGPASGNQRQAAQFISASTPIVTTSAALVNACSALPAGHQQNDLLIIVYWNRTNTAQFEPVTGYVNQGFVLNGSTLSACIFTKTDNGAETIPQVQGYGVGAGAFMLCYRGANATPMDATLTKNAPATTNPYDAPSITTVTDKAQVVYCAFRASNTSGLIASAARGTNRLLNSTATGSGGTSYGVWDETITPIPGASGVNAITAAGNTGLPAAITFAIRPR